MDEDGAASPLAFIVAGLLFLGVVGVLLTVVVQQIPPPTAAQTVTAGHELEARLVLERFVLGTGALGSSAPGLAAKVGELDRAKVTHLMQSTKDDDGRPPGEWTAYYDYAELKPSLTSALQCPRSPIPCDPERQPDFQVYIESATESCTFGPDPPAGSVLVPAAATLQMKDGAGVLQRVQVRVLVFDSLQVYGTAWNPNPSDADNTAVKACLES